MFVPVLSDWLCAVQRGEIHATDAFEVRVVLRGQRRRKTFDTVCGLQRAGLLYVDAVCQRPAGDKLVEDRQDRMALAWPPPATHDEYVRCRECWMETGKKRPEPVFRKLRETAA